MRNGATTAPMPLMVSIATKKTWPLSWCRRPPLRKIIAAGPATSAVDAPAMCRESAAWAAARIQNGAEGSKCRITATSVEGVGAGRSDRLAPTAQPNRAGQAGRADDEADPEARRGEKAKRVGPGQDHGVGGGPGEGVGQAAEQP